ncbi:hypothetical protein PILCRDRAFT_811386 [Piloderma croceum F 1598]|uniref:Gfd2/YDR514C-like C-terminal domain-containing protein n=1 Tax=Piloderma croceum (strain F 1598) TaxID=765440 RepID=A0A0C3GGW4_PILCF|nr:hypothetical protein PILCRDRAFT_811386 [Piloderma croceum F 1598]
MAPVVLGYFRYTDIWFEWHQALPNKEDGSPLKAILAHDSLVHPDHPLRNGKHGIEMYMGTLQNFETRLLFSSAQVEYIRAWLFATKLTKTLIPLPYSDCLLTESNLRNVSPIYFSNGGELRNSLKKIEKNNKRLKGANPILKSRRQTFELVRTFYADKVGVWCACDFEAWDRDHSLLTEFGWSLVRWKDGKEISEQGHLVVQERRNYSNTYVPNNRERYNFGETEFIDKNQFKKRIQGLISDLTKNGPLYLVFHDNNQDIKYLNSKAVEAPLTGLAYMLPDATPDDGIWVIDTGDLFAALEGEPGGNKRGLERVCRHLQIPTEWLHNAGNDAHYTLLALKTMASGDPVDLQREKRWPNRTGEGAPHAPKGVKVEFKPWEEDSDFSDQEGMVGYEPAGGMGSLDISNDE